MIAWFRAFVDWLDSFFPRPAQPAEVPPEVPKIESAPPGAAQDSPKASGMIPLLPSESAALDALANSLGVNPKDLFVLINFESGWSPSARNPVTGARGLIQFMPDTARSLGYRDADDIVSRFPSREAQLNGPVRAYFQRLKPFTGSAQDLFMSVFYPAARKWSLGAQFSKTVQDSNPGIKTPYDYIQRAYAVAGSRYVAPVAVLLVLAGLAWFLLKK